MKKPKAPPARLHVIPAHACDKALVLRRGPARQVASLMWDRKSGTLELGQWLKGRIYDKRCDLSPDGRHMIIFAGAGQHTWTAISRAPWLTAIAYWPKGDTWFGGGAFTPDGRVFGNGIEINAPLPDGLKPAPKGAYPSGTDGFHMGLLFPAMLEARGWAITEGKGYDVTLAKGIDTNTTLHVRFENNHHSKGTYHNSVYTLEIGGKRNEMSDWEWAEPWKDGLHVAADGKLWHVPLTRDGLGDARMLHDLNPLSFEARKAPYNGIQE